MDNKFWSKVEKIDGGCWEYLGRITAKGYGQVKRRKIHKHAIFAHRYSFFLVHGRFPKNLLCHKCDNEKCVNPDHLFEGTHQDNSDDKIRKGRDRHSDQRGELNGRAKLSSKDIIEIKYLIANGESNIFIGKKFGVSHSAISLIRLGRTWNY